MGRNAELSRLVGHVDRAVEGSGGCAVVTGDPGSGKTRLVEALVRPRRVLAHIPAGAPQPDIVPLSGDPTDNGLDAEYEVAAELLSTAKVPLVVCPGNHDVRTRFVRHLGPPESVTDVAKSRPTARTSSQDRLRPTAGDRLGLLEDGRLVTHWRAV